MSNKITTFEQFKMLGNKVKGFVDNQNSNLAGLTSTAISELKTGKQDKLTGKEGQVVGFNSSGNVLNIGGPVNPNLLDNPNFKVNQRGQSSYTSQGYSVDRWLVTESCIVGTNSVTVMGGFVQKLENIDAFISKTLTFTALTDEGLYTGTGRIMDGDVQVWFVPKTNNISLEYTPDLKGFQIVCYESKRLIAAKLELGDHQTLAHQDSSGNWVLNEIPNYALELTKCQRYQQVFTISSLLGTTYSDDTNVVEVAVSLSTTLRAIPTIKNDAIIVFDKLDFQTPPSSISIKAKNNSSLLLALTMPTNVPVNVGLAYVKYNSPSLLILDANL